MAGILDKPIWSADGLTLSNVLLPVTNLYATYNVTTEWYDGTPMDDSKLDTDLVYVKFDDKYLLRNMEYGQVLQKDTMDDMRALSTEEILLLKVGVYKHVQLNGTINKGDVPSPINYILSDTASVDDGGSVISVGDIKLEIGNRYNIDSTTYSVEGSSTGLINNLLKNSYINLSKDITLSARADVYSKSITSGNKSTISLNGSSVIALYNNLNDGSSIKDINIDGQNGGQLNAGLIAVASSKDFLIEDVTIENGGVIGASSPSGVNGISVATSSYPVGEKSTGNINRVVSRNFTKAPINWTTYAEEGALSFSKFYDSVGNGQTPAVQINGGIRFKSVFNHIERTEGAGTIITTVGNQPPLPSKENLSFGNSYYDIGQLGQYTEDEFAVVIADGYATNQVVDNIISHEYAKNPKQGFSRVTGGVNSTTFINNFVRDSQLPFVTLGSSNIAYINNNVENYNKNLATIAPAYFINNCSKVSIDGGVINTSNPNCYLLYSNTGVNNFVSVKNISLNSAIEIMPNSSVQYFRNTSISITRLVTVTNSGSYNVFTGQLIEGRCVTIRVKANCFINQNTYAYQSLLVMAQGTSSSPVIVNNSFDIDKKSGITTGLFVDVTGGNIRIRFLNTASVDIPLNLDIDIYIH